MSPDIFLGLQRSLGAVERLQAIQRGTMKQGRREIRLNLGTEFPSLSPQSIVDSQLNTGLRVSRLAWTRYTAATSLDFTVSIRGER